MSIFKCKICGGSLEIDGAQSVATCEYCGTKQTLPKLNDERRANLYDRANHFRRNNDFDKAMGIYENILNEDNTDSEAYWSIVLCRYGIEYVEDPKNGTRIPTVNRAQFTSIFDDEDYKSAIANADSYQREIYEAEANAINEIQKGILAISEKEEPFDVFIRYKETDNNGRRTQDSVLATELYGELTRGIKEIVKLDAPKIQVKETVVQAAPSVNVEQLLKRAFMALKDGEFGRADEFCEQVLNQDAENARAYLGKLMSELHVKAQSDLANCPYAFDGSKNYQKAVKFADTSLSFELIGYVEAIKERNARIAEEKRKEAIYLEAMDNYKSYSIPRIMSAIHTFVSLGDYSDSRERIRLCQEKIDQIKAKEEQDRIEQARLEKLAQEKRARQKKKLCIIFAVAAALVVTAIVFGCIYYFAIYPNSLKNSDNFDDYVTYIEDFSDGHFDIPDGVTEIPSYAFEGCHKLKSITIPDSVISIGHAAFLDCTSLTSVTIGNGVTSIGSNAFSGCTSLTGITVADNNQYYTDVDGNLYSKDGKTLIQYAIGKINTNFTIPNSVTSIGSDAFAHCKSLTSVTIPDSVTNIGSWAFAHLSSLTSIKYRGTQSEWNAISKGSLWDYSTGSYTITYNYTGE